MTVGCIQGPWVRWQACLETQLTQHVGGSEAQLVLSFEKVDDKDPGEFKPGWAVLTLDEVEDLRDNLTSLLKMAGHVHD